ncbi:MAG: MotA/TolQ/ExbB proton channel family protein [Deltaproteobacteria bacterium]|nr:MotA/TolQ/ExbB proton channel family protein [Deltaproteobacteria bacterium]
MKYDSENRKAFRVSILIAVLVTAVVWILKVYDIHISAIPDPLINTPTAVFSSLVIMWFCGMLAYMRQQFKSLMTHLIIVNHQLGQKKHGSVTTLSDLNELDDTFKCHETVEKLWEEYKEGIPAYNNRNNSESDQNVGNAIPASEIFSWNNIVTGIFSDHIYNLTPTILSGLGILGTFYGIITGLSGIHFDQLSEGTTRLLESMKVAFISSFYGVTTSLIFSFVNRIYQDKIEKAVSDLSYHIDNLIPRVTGEELLVTLNYNIKRMAQDIAVIVDETDNGLAAKIGEAVNGGLGAEFNSMNKVLSALSGMDSGMLSDKVGEKLRESIESEFAKITEMLHQFQSWFVFVFQQVQYINTDQLEISKRIKELSDIQQVNLEKSSQVNSDLVSVEGKVSAIVNETSQMVEKSNEQLKQIDESTLRITDILEKSNSSQNELITGWRESSESFVKAHNDFASLVNNHLETVNGRVDGFLGKFDEALAAGITNLQDSLADYERNIEGLNKYLSKIDEVNNSFAKELPDNFKNIAALFESQIRELKNAVNR